jgi:hypothetical protein
MTLHNMHRNLHRLLKNASSRRRRATTVSTHVRQLESRALLTTGAAVSTATNVIADVQYANLAAADVDGDGDQDLFATWSTNGYTNNKVVWLENDGTPDSGAWTQHEIQVSIQRVFQELMPADVDNDGDIDLVTLMDHYGSGNTGDRIRWYENDGTPHGDTNWTAVDITDFSSHSNGVNLNGATVGDFNSDGLTDVIVQYTPHGFGATKYLKSFENPGTGAGDWQVTSTSTLTGSFGDILAADMDNDGDTDVVYSQSDLTNSGIYYLENTGGANLFATRTLVSSDPWTPAFLDAGDIDGDGDLDLVSRNGTGVSHPASDAVMWFQNDGTPESGTWASYTVSEGSGLNGQVKLVDVDEDGDLDVMLSDEGLVWYKNNGNPTGSPWGECRIAQFAGSDQILVDHFDSDGVVEVVAFSVNYPARWLNLDLDDVITGPAATTQDQTPTLEWDEIVGAVEYDLWINKIGPAGSGIQWERMLVPSNSYTPDFDYGIGRFYFWVRAKFSNGDFSQWTTSSYPFRIDTAPVIEGVAPQTGSTPTITWNAIPGAGKYEIWVDNISTGEVKAVHDADIQGTSYQLQLGTGRHRIWVRGLDVQGVGAKWSVPVTYEGMASTVLLDPVDIATFNSTPEFTWEELSGASSYEIWIEQVGGSVINEVGITSTSWTPSTALADDEYEWWVRPYVTDLQQQEVALNWTARGEFSLGFTTITGVSESQGLFTLDWNASDVTTLYYLWIADDTSAIYTNQLITTTSFELPVALSSGDYRAWVAVVDPDTLQWTWSPEFDFTVADSQPLDHSSGIAELNSLLATLQLPLDVSSSQEVHQTNRSAAITDETESRPTADRQDPSRLNDQDVHSKAESSMLDRLFAAADGDSVIMNMMMGSFDRPAVIAAPQLTAEAFSNERGTSL